MSNWFKNFDGTDWVMFFMGLSLVVTIISTSCVDLEKVKNQKNVVYIYKESK